MKVTIVSTLGFGTVTSLGMLVPGAEKIKLLIEIGKYP